MTYTTRRRVLATTGALAAGGTALVSGASAANGNEDGMLVFVYDDSPIEDYTMTFPIHQEYDAPGCIGACPGLMDESDAFMDPEHVQEMHEAGWEVMSHTLDHRALGHTPLERDAESGDDRIWVQSNLHGDHPGDPLVVLDGDEEIEATAAGAGIDDGDHYIELESGLDAGVEATDQTFVRYTEEFTREILEESKNRIEEWGIPVTGFVYTYDRYHGLVEELVPEYYDASPNYRSQGGHNAISALEPLELVRQYLETDRIDEDGIDEFVGTIAEDDVLGIFGGHSQFEEMTEDQIAYALESADEHGVRVVTLQEALEELGHLDVHTVEADDGETDDGNGGGNETDDATGANESSDTVETNSTDEDDGSDDGMPGFGVAAGTAGVVGGAAYAARRLASSDDEH